MSRPWMIFTDLDGTLLDARDFSWEPARLVLRRLQMRDVPVIPVTSKTLGETVRICDELGLSGPLVVESGGGIAHRARNGWSIEGRGILASRIEELVPEIEQASGASLALFSAMSEEEAARVSGLSGEALNLARRRQFDVPFLTDGDIASISKAAETLGLSVKTGGRFHHLCGPSGKGDAVREIVSTRTRELEATPLVIALGDAAMDAEFVALADVKIAIPRPDGSVDPVLAALPLIRIASTPGPAGWAAEIHSLLDQEEDPT